MHILKKNDKLGIDNQTLDLKEIKSKLVEESCEVCNAIEHYRINKSLVNLKEIIRETLDEPNLIQDINIEHKDKLISQRSWVIETGIEIDVKE